MRRHAALACAAALLIAGCASATTGSTTTTEAPTTTVAATTTTAAVASTTTEPETTTTTSVVVTTGVSPVTGVLDTSYHTKGTFDPEIMGFDVGDVTAEWYQAEGYYVVVYAGLDLDESGPLCPGASAQLPDRNGFFDFTTNAATPDADCSGFKTLTQDPAVRTLVCNGALAFRTAIPAGSEGTLYASLEKSDNGGIIGVVGSATTDMGPIPAIDPTTLEC
jgi:hypothetical protein